MSVVAMFFVLFFDLFWMLSFALLVSPGFSIGVVSLGPTVVSIGSSLLVTEGFGFSLSPMPVPVNSRIVGINNSFE